MLLTARTKIYVVVITLLSSQVTAITPLNQDPADINPYALEESSLIAPTLGLELLLPKDAMVTSDQRPGMLNYLILDGVSEEPTWSMRIQSLNSTQEDPTAAGLVAQYLELVEADKTLINEPVNYANKNGHQLFVEKTTSQDQSVAVLGWVILPTSQRTFIVFAVKTTPERFPLLFGQLKASFSTIRLMDNDQINAQRMTKLTRGRAIINAFTPAKLKTLIGRESWYRIYTPSQSGKLLDDQEMGYMSLRCDEGMRGQLNPGKSESKYTQMEAEQGLMVTVELRVLGEQPNQILDVYSQYWLAWDRSSESWSTLSTFRQGDRAMKTTGETGVRQRGHLTVITSDKDSMTRDSKDWTISDSSYLSQPEVFFLGSLLPQEESLTDGMSFYSYDTNKKSVPLRTDTWEQATDGSGNWVLSTRSVKAVNSARQIFDRNGNLLRRISDDGIFFEAIDRRELEKLWHAKGLSR